MGEWLWLPADDRHRCHRWIGSIDPPRSDRIGWARNRMAKYG